METNLILFNLLDYVFKSTILPFTLPFFPQPFTPLPPLFFEFPSWVENSFNLNQMNFKSTTPLTATHLILYENCN